MPNPTRIMLTGSTGFLGGAVVAELLTSSRWSEVLLLVRAATPEEGVVRVTKNLARFDLSPAQLALVLPEQIICGDLTNLDAFVHDERLQFVTHVLNCAAVTSFGTHPKIWETNVHGTLRLARHVRRLPRLKRFIQVGTAMICGDAPARVVHEDDYPGEKVRHLVEYTASKAEAEIRLREEFGEGLLVVARPSIIVGHTRLGCRPSHSIFWAFRMSDAMRRVTCDVDGVIDVVPVDYAARALTRLLTRPTLKHDTYHISAGMAACSSFRDISTAFSLALEDHRTDTYQTVSYDDLIELQPRFHEFFGRCNRRFLLRAMKLYGGFASLGTSFDNSRLLAESVPPPPRFTDYLHRCVETSKERTISEQMMIDFQ